MSIDAIDLTGDACAEELAELEFPLPLGDDDVGADADARVSDSGWWPQNLSAFLRHCDANSSVSCGVDDDADESNGCGCNVDVLTTNFR